MRNIFNIKYDKENNKVLLCSHGTPARPSEVICEIDADMYEEYIGYLSLMDYNKTQCIVSYDFFNELKEERDLYQKESETFNRELYYMEHCPDKCNLWKWIKTSLFGYSDGIAYKPSKIGRFSKYNGNEATLYKFQAGSWFSRLLEDIEYLKPHKDSKRASHFCIATTTNVYFFFPKKYEGKYFLKKRNDHCSCSY